LAWRFLYSHSAHCAECVFLTFSAGISLSCVNDLVGLADEQVSLSIVGYFSLVGVAYSFEVLLLHDHTNAWQPFFG
jgi:hypothetical protein